MPKLKYNESNKHFLINKNKLLMFKPALATILGVGVNQNPLRLKDDDTLKWISANVSDITLGINYIVLYCDLLEHVLVGDTKVPLLRIFDAKGNNGEMLHHSYDEPRYIPLQKKNVNSIEMDLRDDFGNPISFKNGKLVVTLHFRLAKKAYFLN